MVSRAPASPCDIGKQWRSEDELERVQLQQRLLEAENPATDGYEDRYIEHAKSWADKTGVSENAFLAEGVSVKVLRKARSAPGEDRLLSAV